MRSFHTFLIQQFRVLQCLIPAIMSFNLRGKKINNIKVKQSNKKSEYEVDRTGSLLLSTELVICLPVKDVLLRYDFS